MTTAEEYIESVLEQMPRRSAMRTPIAMELRGNIAERLEQGHSLEDALRQLGDPALLAESYLAAVPLVSADPGRRIGAKLVDALIALALFSPLALYCRQFAPAGDAGVKWMIVLTTLGSCAVLGFVTMIAEAMFDQTPGKRLLGLRVVRESGARMSFGQAVVRQLPLFIQVIWVDALFALFTERRQRAFELLSRTRVVALPPGETTP